MLPTNSSHHQLVDGIGLIGAAIDGATTGSGSGVSNSVVDSFLGAIDDVAGTLGASDGGCVTCVVARLPPMLAA